MSNWYIRKAMTGHKQDESGVATVQPRTRTRTRTRMRPEDREKFIAEGATRYFADHGFDIDTRSLAQHLGITHSLLFRYFPSKEALVDRVYRDIFVSRWSPYWEIVIEDRTRTIKDRMHDFFQDYAKTVLDREWIRVFFFAGLKGSPLNTRFLEMMRQRVLLPLCRELRHSFGLPAVADEDITEFEQELVWGIIGRIVYFGVRKWIYQTPVPGNLAAHIDATIDTFFGGVERVLRGKLADAPRPSTAVAGASATRPAHSPGMNSRISGRSKF